MAACDNFSSSSDEENKFFRFLPEEINFENLKRRAEESDLSIDEYSSSGESQETSDEDVSADRWTEKLRDVYIQEFAEDVGATFILESEAKEQDFFGKIFADEYLFPDIHPLVFGGPFHFKRVCFNEGGTKS
eukprot:gene1848-16341_t